MLSAWRRTVVSENMVRGRNNWINIVNRCLWEMAQRQQPKYDTVPFNAVFDRSHDVKMCLFFISYSIGPFVNIKSVHCVLPVYTRQLNNAKRCKFVGTHSSDSSTTSIIAEIQFYAQNTPRENGNKPAKKKITQLLSTEWRRCANVNIVMIYLKVTFWCSPCVKTLNGLAMSLDSL